MAQQATVLLRNLNEASTHASVAAALAEFGPVKRVDVIRGRGFGFVKFATAADAQKAVRAGRDHGIDVDGSVVEVALARDKGQKHPNAVEKPIPKADGKRESQRSVRGRSARVFGIPAGASDKAVYKRLRKLEGFEKVASVDGAAMRPAGALAVATFVSLQKASSAVQRLDGATFKGSKLSCRLEAHVDRSHDQRGRLVVRNLHFRALEEDLLDAFMAYGPIKEARVPRVGEKSRGFGFVEFFCEADARRALKAASAGEFKVKGRPVAVDQATPKSDHVAAAPAVEAAEDVASASDDADEASDGDEESEAVEEEDEEDDEEESDEEASEEKPDDVAEGRTLFVRNVPYGATRKALAELFARSGSIESVHVVKDKATGLGKGSCFVRYTSQDSATNATVQKWALDARPLVVALAVDQSTASKLRDEVGPAKKRKLEHALVGGDRRHVALASEGLIQKGDPAAIGVPENDLKKRERARQEAATKLRNPLFHVNPQRLSVRNLAPHVDAALLKELIEAAGVSGKDVGAVHVARDKVPTVPGKKPKPGKSKGYAFAEFASHACAMRVLRYANNNPELASYCVPRGKKTGSEVPRPIVAFVVEDHRKVALRQKREEDAKATATAPLDGPSRKERRREKRIANRLEKKRARKGEAPAVAAKKTKVVDEVLLRDRADDRAVEQVFDAAERKRDKKRRKKKAPEQDVEYAYKAPQPDYLASLKKAVVAGEGRWFE